MGMGFEYGAYSATYRYEPVKLTGYKNIVCAGGCGKKQRRQRTFSQTISPFNRNAQGHPCSRAEIMDKLRAEVAEWKTEPIICSWCKNAEK